MEPFTELVELEWSGSMTFGEVSKIALEVFPDAQVAVDNDGQWVIYTNLKEKDDA